MGPALGRRWKAVLSGSFIALACLSIAGFCLIFLLNEMLLLTVGDFSSYLGDDSHTWPPPGGEDAHAEITPSGGASDTEADECKLPVCLKPSADPQFGNRAKRVPQIILLTFEGLIQEQNYGYFTQLLDGNLRNPNGCPITATFYLSHQGGNEYTNYDLVKELHSRGHEISNHGANLTAPRSWWRDAGKIEWKNQLVNQRRNLALALEIDESEIPGVRAPFLETNGDALYRAIDEYQCLYDSSLIVSPARNASGRWPWTLDSGLQRPGLCLNDVCPRAPHPGLWEVPLNQHLDFHGAWTDPRETYRSIPRNAPRILQVLKANFQAFREENRAPFMVRITRSLMEKNSKFIPTLRDFLAAALRENPDVYVITVSQMLSWIQKGAPVNNLDKFDLWRRSCRPLSQGT